MAFSSRPRFSPTPLLLLLLSGAGCGGDSDGSGSPTSLDELFSRATAASCKFEVACGYSPDMATCLASQRDDLGMLATIEADIASGKVSYDSVKARSCIEWLERYFDAAACTQSMQAAVGSEGIEACLGAFAGTVAPGGACFFPEECAGRGSCRPTDSTCLTARQCCPGTCVAKPVSIPMGGDCSTTQPCVAGTTCAATASGGPFTCLVPSKVEGTACGSSTSCATPLYCDLAGTLTCRRAAPTGAPCNTAVLFGSCDDHRDYCDDTTGICTRRAAVGGACDPAQANCIGYAECRGTICVAQPAPGDACGPTDPTCLGELECSTQTSTCALPPAFGACI